MMRRTREGISPFAARQDAVSSGDPPVHSPAVGDPDFSRPSETEQTRRPASFEGGSPGGNSGGATVGKASSTSSSTAAVTPGEASINLANCIMGAGALSLPAFFKSCGVVLGVLLLLASCAWTWASAVMMVKTADVVSLRVLKGAPVSSYEELMSLTLGTRGHILSTVGILLLQIGCLVGYANILADVVSPFAIDILPPGLEPNRASILTAVCFGAMLPIGIAVGADGGSRGLAAVSKASILIVGVFAAVMSWCGAQKSWEMGAMASAVGSAGVIGGQGAGLIGGTTLGSIAHQSPMAYVNWAGAMSVLPLAIFAFGAHPAILPMTYAMRPRGLKPSINVITTVLTLCAVCYLMIGLGGYSAFRQHTAGNVLRNADGRLLGEVGSKLFKFGYGLVILASVPTILLPLQKSAKDAYLTLVPLIVPPVRTLGGPLGGVGALGGLNTPGGKISGVSDVSGGEQEVPPEVASRLASAVAVVAMTAALWLSLYVPNVAFAFGLTGSTCSFLIAFILPAASFLSVTSRGGNGVRLQKGSSSTKKALRLIEMGGPSRVSRTTHAVDPVDNSFVITNDREPTLMHRSSSGGALTGGNQMNQTETHSQSLWFGGEDPDSDDRDDDALLFKDDEVTVGLFEVNKGVPESPKKRLGGLGVSKHVATRRWRFGAKVQIVVAIVLSVSCTREVLRELMHENALVTVVSKMADAKLSAEKIETESTQIAAAKEKFEKTSAELDTSVKDAEKALGAVHEHRDSDEKHEKEDGKSDKTKSSATSIQDSSTENVGSDIDVITATLEARLRGAINGVSDEDGNGDEQRDETGEGADKSTKASKEHPKDAAGSGKSVVTYSGTVTAGDTDATQNTFPDSAETRKEQTELLDQETLGKWESTLIDGAADESLAETVFVAKESLEKVKKVEAAASNTTLAKSGLLDAIKHSDEFQEESGKGSAGQSHPGGKAFDEGIKEKEDDADVDSEQATEDAEAKKLVGGAGKAGKDSDEDDEKSNKVDDTPDVTPDDIAIVDDSVNASSVVAMADEKISELSLAKQKVESEAELEFKTAVATKGIDETLANDLVSALANLTSTGGGG